MFFAARPDDDARRQLAQVQATFDPDTARAVSPDNFHLTLAFLGEIPADERECCSLAAGAIEIPEFAVTLDRFGCFGRQRPLCWIGPTAIPVDLLTLHKRLHRALAVCGYHERRRFTPHVTLFRKAERLTAPDETPSIELRVDRFFLFESVRKDDDIVYVPIEEYRRE